ncbi:unnamed protein product [Thlaspi arvense]|uniref:Zinc finger PHD-type domain-containing protein n=1 Tax=Thlaspi arvense TaxID=13288 RepID=A0AAU9R7S9_THLAR|nr:unnamed protein product [Thlaspi arvense]
MQKTNRKAKRRKGFKISGRHALAGVEESRAPKLAPVCQTCGDIGFEEQLVYCYSCRTESVHRYCLGITPVPFAVNATWFCEGCDRSESHSDCKEDDETAYAKSGDILEKNEKENKETNNQTSPVLVFESVSEGVSSSTVQDHKFCTSKRRSLSSGNIRVTSENTQLAAENSSCKEAESNMPQTNEVVTAPVFNSLALGKDRALPIYEPIWRGSISVKTGNISGIDGLVAHLSSLACHKVHEKARSLQARLPAEMFPRLEIWPDSFLKNKPPTDESIALYFFPSSKSNDEKVYNSLVCEMKKNDLAMRCVVDNVDLLLFTSYQLPMHCWSAERLDISHQTRYQLTILYRILPETGLFLVDLCKGIDQISDNFEIFLIVVELDIDPIPSWTVAV